MPLKNPEREPPEFQFLTYAQKHVLKSYGHGYRIIQTHGNGDVTIDIAGTLFIVTPGGSVYEQGTAYKPPQSKKPPVVPSGPSVINKPEVKRHFPIYDQETLWGEEVVGNPPKPPKPPKPAEPYKPQGTICQEDPVWCQPRLIKHVAWDADHTIWNMEHIASSVTGPLKKIDDDTVVELDEKAKNGGELEKIANELLLGLSPSQKAHFSDYSSGGKPPAYRTTIKLMPTFRQTLDELEKRGITSSIISLNTPGSVKRILETFGLSDRFVDIRDSWENKGKVFKEQTQKLGICPCSGIFVDDRHDHVEDVTKKCGLGLQIGPGKDIHDNIEVLKFIKV